MNKNDRILLNEATREAGKLMINQGISIANILNEYEKVKHLILYEDFVELCKKRVVNFYKDVV